MVLEEAEDLLLAELKQAFKEDCGLELQLSKCKLYIKGMSLSDARQLVRDTIEQEPRLCAFSDMLHVHEDQSKNVIQVEESRVSVSLSARLNSSRHSSRPKPRPWLMMSGSCACSLTHSHIPGSSGSAITPGSPISIATCRRM